MATAMDQPKRAHQGSVPSGSLPGVWRAGERLLARHFLGRGQASRRRQDHTRNVANSSIALALVDAPFPLGIRLGLIDKR
jgi:hypothetical protein